MKNYLLIIRNILYHNKDYVIVFFFKKKTKFIDAVASMGLTRCQVQLFGLSYASSPMVVGLARWQTQLP